MFGGFRALPYASVLAQVNDLDDKEYNTLPPQPPRRKPPTPKKQKHSSQKDNPLKPKASSDNGSNSGQRKEGQLSDKAHHIQSKTADHTPEDANVWADIMKLAGTKRNNEIADGFCTWLNKNFDSGIHQVIF